MQMKIERKKTRLEKINISRAYTRNLIWAYFVKFCRNRFGFDYILDNDYNVEITKIYNLYLTIKN